jgi:formylglycine-generating enzyme required for sulfatase activity
LFDANLNSESLGSVDEVKKTKFFNILLFLSVTFLASGIIVPKGWASSLMVEIPAGSFIQGPPLKSPSTEEASVYLEAFLIDTHEVTNEEFSEKFSDHTFWPGAEPHPVSQVTWNEAQKYCRLAGKRLPTESEWEKSARGPDGRIYPWGKKVLKKKPHPFYSGIIKRRVGLNRKDVSFYGVRDMAGSVWEWTSDRVEDKAVARGGLWNLHLDYEYSKTYERNLIPPDRRFIFLGFRCARSK